MQEIETEIKVFAEKSFAYVTTTEDELNVLRIMYHYSNLHSLKSYFVEKNHQVDMTLSRKFHNIGRFFRHNVLIFQLINNILMETREIKECTFFFIIKPFISHSSTLDLVIATFLKKRRLQFVSKVPSEIYKQGINRL